MKSNEIINEAEFKRVSERGAKELICYCLEKVNNGQYSFNYSIAEWATLAKIDLLQHPVKMVYYAINKTRENVGRAEYKIKE